MTKAGRTLLVLLVSLTLETICHAQVPDSLTEYKVPTKELKLDAKDLERILAAKTVTVLAKSSPLLIKRGKEVAVTFRSGRSSADKAKADVMKVLGEWGVFTAVEDPGTADLVLVIAEETLGPNFMSDGKARLKDTLAVFPTGGPGVADPLWIGIDTENALAAASGLSTPDAEGVAERFRRDVENLRSRLKTSATR
jgi:hypothetical protein